MSERPEADELRDEQAARKAAEERLAREAVSEDEADQHARRAEKSAYLERKLAERTKSERDD